jgi:hypothetical protein
MPKPYSILAAALVASGRSLSTVTISASIDRRALSPTESEEWFADSDRMGSFKSLRDGSVGGPRARERRHVGRIACGCELGSERIFPQALILCDVRPRRNLAPKHALKPWRS